jgi:hypothetical protein
MYRIGLAVFLCLLLACNGKDENADQTENNDESSLSAFSNRFTTAPLPYQLTDTVLLNNKDTATLPAKYLGTLVPDSVVRKIFGKTTSVRYTPLARLAPDGKESYYVLKASSGAKKAALLMVYDKGGAYGGTMPFLVPDNNTGTSQATTIDKSLTITKAVMQRTEGAVVGEGKEVLAWDASEKKFSLIMTDLLHDNPEVLVNPIDTFPRNNKLAGDYYLNKKNLLAVRDGRYANQILVYIHTENSNGDCIGELKGEFVLTSSSTAVYRQGGDPCVLALTFEGNSISMNEERGCGNYRGLDCPLTGTFTRKKEEKPKESTKKPKQGKRVP